jgi:16S rRNA (guanine966-N2)-methyltransferase
MRIVSGIYGGRRLIVPKGRDIRPTSDKVRGAIFNALESRGAVRSAVVMDVFCGTGALGLEALSRGASHCTFIDKARDSLSLARENANAFGAQALCDFILKDAASLAPRPENTPPATLVFLDPPYHMALAAPALEALHAGGWLMNDVCIILETEKNFNYAVLPEFLRVETEKTYGDTKVMFIY